MKAFLLCLTLALAASAALSEVEYQNSFTNWMRQHSKSYGHEEFLTRYSIFKKNLDFINAHNGQESFTVAMNQFGDLSNAEFKRLYNGVRVPENRKPTGNAQNVEQVTALPAHWDWRTSGAVTGVKNQGQCGSCWSFSTTGSTEGCHKITTGTLVSLSEQNLIDCSTSYGNQGCDGGLMDDAFQYIIANKGIDTESSYPYTATGPNQCEYSASNCGSTVSSYTDVTSGSESALQDAVYKTPVSVAIDAGLSSFQFYSSGVYYAPDCSSTQLDHGVLAVGWGKEADKDYWIVKNSWGASWGMNGYILMSRNRNNNCGIATMASYPSGCGTC